MPLPRRMQLNQEAITMPVKCGENIKDVLIGLATLPDWANLAALNSPKTGVLPRFSRAPRFHS